MKTKRTEQQIEFEKFSDEARLDSNQRAKDTMDYERMLMSYIESQVLSSKDDIA